MLVNSTRPPAAQSKMIRSDRVLAQPLLITRLPPPVSSQTSVPRPSTLPLLPFLASPRPYHLPLTADLTDAQGKAVPCTAIYISSLTVHATRRPDSRIAVAGRGTDYSRPKPACLKSHRGLSVRTIENDQGWVSNSNAVVCTQSATGNEGWMS